MICDKCKLKQASVHYRYNDNGKVTEMHLCQNCAKEEGLLNDGESLMYQNNNGSLFGSNFFSIPFGGILDSKPKNVNLRVCSSCGMSEIEFRNSGKFGCEKCYSVFKDLVYEMLLKLHSSTEYKGKIPAAYNEKISVSKKLEKLKEDMADAVLKQEYEEAARIRDVIKKLESDKVSGDNGSDSI